MVLGKGAIPKRLTRLANYDANSMSRTSVRR